jgi:hypothetical protein
VRRIWAGEGAGVAIAELSLKVNLDSAMADSVGISLEETNKIRISLGLKPLTDDKAPVADKEKEAEDNYAKVRAQENKTRADK